MTIAHAGPHHYAQPYRVGATESHAVVSELRDRIKHTPEETA